MFKPAVSALALTLSLSLPTMALAADGDVSTDSSAQSLSAPHFHSPTSAASPLMDMPTTLSGGIIQSKTVVIPQNTVVNISLLQPLTSKTSQVGDQITAVIKDGVYMGPYLMIPPGSQIHGVVSNANAHTDNLGRHPYVVVVFDQLIRPGDTEVQPFHGTMIAYKTGVRKQDYVWKLPEKGKRTVSIGGVLGGALTGFLFDPLLGPPIGAGAMVIKDVSTDRIAKSGEIKIKPTEILPIAVDQPFSLNSVAEVVNPQTMPHPASSVPQPLSQPAEAIPMQPSATAIQKAHYIVPPLPTNNVPITPAHELASTSSYPENK